MIGHNLSHHILTADDARAYASAIAALRAEAERLAKPYDRSLAAFKKDTDAIRAERDAATKPLGERADSLRDVLAEWLRADPDGSLKDGDRVVATLARKAGEVRVDAALLPEAFKTLQPSMALINAALDRGKSVPGVTVPIKTILRVMT